MPFIGEEVRLLTSVKPASDEKGANKRCQNNILSPLSKCVVVLCAVVIGYSQKITHDYGPISQTIPKSVVLGVFGSLLPTSLLCVLSAPRP